MTKLVIVREAAVAAAIVVMLGGCAAPQFGPSELKDEVRWKVYHRCMNTVWAYEKAHDAWIPEEEAVWHCQKVARRAAK